jgi:hypothetical protein
LRELALGCQHLSNKYLVFPLVSITGKTARRSRCSFSRSFMTSYKSKPVRVGLSLEHFSGMLPLVRRSYFNLLLSFLGERV